MKRKYLLLIILFILLLPQLCYSDYKELMEQVRNKYPDEKYYYVMPEEQQEKFFRNFDEIKLGDSLEKVKELCGKPLKFYGYTHWLFGNRTYCCMTYYIKKFESVASVSTHDIVFYFYFNRNQELFSIECPSFKIYKEDNSLEPKRGFWINLFYSLFESTENDKAQEQSKDNTSPE